MKAEFDSVVVECAGSVIGPLAAIVGGERFAPFLEQLKTLLLNKLVSERKEERNDASFVSVCVVSQYMWVHMYCVLVSVCMCVHVCVCVCTCTCLFVFVHASGGGFFGVWF